MGDLTTDENSIRRFIELNEKKTEKELELKHRVLILSTPRSGSNLFGDVLEQTGGFGSPLEWFNPRFIQAYMQALSLADFNLQDYLNFVVNRTTTRGVFSVKVHLDQWLWLQKQNINLFDLGFTHVYSVARKQKIDQAYSYAKALASDQWTASEKPGKAFKGTLARTQILEALWQLAGWDELYQQQLRDKVQREFFYEDFSNLESTQVFEQVCADLNLQPPLEWATQMQRQRNEADRYQIAELKFYLDPLRFSP